MLTYQELLAAGEAAHWNCRARIWRNGRPSGDFVDPRDMPGGPEEWARRAHVAHPTTRFEIESQPKAAALVFPEYAQLWTAYPGLPTALGRALLFAAERIAASIPADWEQSEDPRVHFDGGDPQLWEILAEMRLAADAESRTGPEVEHREPEDERKPEAVHVESEGGPAPPTEVRDPTAAPSKVEQHAAEQAAPGAKEPEPVEPEPQARGAEPGDEAKRYVLRENVAGGFYAGTTDAPPPGSIVEAAQRYAKRGWVPIPILLRNKKPINAWGKLRTPQDGLAAVQKHPTENVGIYLGDVSGGLVDVDLDCKEAILLASRYLPKTGAIFGRPSKPCSHWLYNCPGLLIRQFKDHDDKMVIEVRGNTKERANRKTLGGQTVFPPSVHTSSELIAWAQEGEPAKVDAETLYRAARIIQVGVTLGRLWPASGRHDFALAAAGTLAHADVPIELATDFFEAALMVAGLGDRDAELQRCLTDTYDNFAANIPIRTLSSLVADGVISETTLTRLHRMLQFRGRRSSKKERIYFYESNPADVAVQITRSLAAQPYYDREAGPCVLVAHQPTNDAGEPVGGEFVRLERARPERMLIDCSMDYQWATFNAKDEEVPRMPKTELFGAYLAAGHETRVLPWLSGLVRAPTLAPRTFDPITTQGYDEKSGLYLYWPSPDAVSITDDPALLPGYRDLFDGLLAEVAFVEPVLGRAVWVFGLLCVLVKPAVGATPAIYFDSPTPGSGKTFLVELTGQLGNGHLPVPLAVGWNEEEFEKRFSGAILEGANLIPLDNISREIGGDTLCQALTRDEVKTRVLGKTGNPTVPCSAVVYMTGNNATISADLVRRVMLVRLDPKMERPELRQFAQDPMRMVAQRRAQYLGAALSILRTHHQHPEASGLQPIASYTGVQIVREAVRRVWGVDPMQAILKNDSAHESGQSAAGLFAALEGLYADRWFTAGDTAASTEYVVLGTPGAVVRTYLAECRGVTAIGRKLGELRDKIAGGRCLESEINKESNARRFRVRRVV